jgi:hypothetical protein
MSHAGGAPPVGIKKKQTAIAAADVPRLFNDACFEQLAIIGRLPDTADRQRFGESIREAARIYAEDARRATIGKVRDEIASLYKAAEHKRYDRAAMLLANLSPEACTYLEALELPGPRGAGLRLPTADKLRDPKRRDEACEMIERLCRIGGGYVVGRKRSPGKRSKTWRPLLFAPVPDKHPPKREAELQFVMNLQLAWLEAVGKPPTATVNPSRPDRPFANLVKKCLKLANAHADAVGLINELRSRRNQERKCLTDLRRRQRREARETK